MDWQVCKIRVIRCIFVKIRKFLQAEKAGKGA